MQTCKQMVNFRSLLLLEGLLAFLCALVQRWAVYCCSGICSYACVVGLVEARVIYGGMHARFRIARGQSNSRCSLPICFSIALVSLSVHLVVKFKSVLHLKGNSLNSIPLLLFHHSFCSPLIQFPGSLTCPSLLTWTRYYQSISPFPARSIIQSGTST